MVVVLDCHLATQFRELMRVARLLRSSGRYQPIFNFTDPPADALVRMREVLAREQLPHVSFEPTTEAANDDAPRKVPTPPPPRSPFKRWLANLPELGTLAEATPDAIQTLRRRFVSAPRFLDAHSPALIVTGEDGMGANRPLLAAARARGIPIVVVPFQISTRREPAEAIVNLPAYRTRFGMDSVVNRIAAACFPRWAYNYDGQVLLREPALNIVVDEMIGTAPGEPWTVHGGAADALLVESPRMQRHYLAEGVRAHKLVLTGALYDDELAANLAQRAEQRAALCASFGLDPKRRTLLCSLPPAVGNRPDCDFAAYDDLVSFWLASLRHPDVNVIVQLHPTISTAEARRITELGGRISSEDITRLIPACDALITSISSIIRLAITCGVPVLNYDVYRYGYTDYDAVGGVIKVTEQADFSRWARDLALDDDTLRKLAAQQARASSDWGMLDGQAGARMLAVIDSLVGAAS